MRTAHDRGLGNAHARVPATMERRTAGGTLEKTGIRIDDLHARVQKLIVEAMRIGEIMLQMDAHTRVQNLIVEAMRIDGIIHGDQDQEQKLTEGGMVNQRTSFDRGHPRMHLHEENVLISPAMKRILRLHHGTARCKGLNTNM